MVGQNLQDLLQYMSLNFLPLEIVFTLETGLVVFTKPLNSSCHSKFALMQVILRKEWSSLR